LFSITRDESHFFYALGAPSAQELRSLALP
jgi:hypothetical protein